MTENRKINSRWIIRGRRRTRRTARTRTGVIRKERKKMEEAEWEKTKTKYQT